MAIHLVWRIDPAVLFETQWIRELLSRGNIDYDDIYDLDGTSVVSNAVIVFNHSVDYETYFQRYQDSNTPFGAIHLSDETLTDTTTFYGHTMCKFVFRNYHNPLVASRHNHVITFGLGYKQGFVDSSTTTEQPNGRYYNWSFAGNIHTPERLACILPFESLIPHFVHTTREGFNASSGLAIDKYASLMRDSKFAICPIGQGNIDSFRVYEALEAGAIPIVVASTQAQPYQPSYWHAIFPWMRAVTIPMLIHRDWHDAAKTMAKMLQDKSIYEDVHSQLQKFWNDAKNIWGITLANYCAGLSVMQLDLS